MLVAKTVEAQEALQAQFRERLVDKTYVGWSPGYCPKGRHYRRADRAGFRLQEDKGLGIRAGGANGFQDGGKSKKHAMLEIYPRTGRTNQIRIHLEFIGHPIVGDKLYGGEKAPLLLHSARSPSSTLQEQKTTLKVELPEDFKTEWSRIKKAE